MLLELSNSTLEENAAGFEEFIEICRKILNHPAPAKQKFVWGCHLPFMNKTLSKAVMLSTRFRNKYLRNKTDQNRRKYTKQRNYCCTSKKIKERILQ